jgi:palmitoyltransferase
MAPTQRGPHSKNPKSPQSQPKQAPSSQKSPQSPPPQQHGHSHGGKQCSHNHGGDDSGSGDDDGDGDDNAHGHSHGRFRGEGPTKIPYYIVIAIIIGVWGGYLVAHYLENRHFITTQGTDPTLPYVLPKWLPFSQESSKLSFIFRPIYHLTPLSTHPAQWITFCIISWCFFLSFIRVTFTNPGCVDQFDPLWGFAKQSVATQNHFNYQFSQYHLPGAIPNTIELKHNATRRYCHKTNTFKPDRAHYCHATGRLVKRLDHYCIFLSASVGYNNHKFFILFLFWVVVLGFFISTKLVIGMNFINNLYGMHMLINLIVACFGGASSLALCGFLGFHLWLIKNSLTTIESGEKYNIWDHNSGYYKKSNFNVNLLLNFQQIFGHGHFLTWFLPVHPVRYPDEDGTLYPIALDVYPQGDDFE